MVGGAWMGWSNRHICIRIDICHDESEWFPILLCLIKDVCCMVSKRMRWYGNTSTTHYPDAFAASWANCIGCIVAKDVGDSAPKSLRFTRNRVEDRRTKCIDWEKVSNFTFDLIDGISLYWIHQFRSLFHRNSFADFRFFFSSFFFSLTWNNFRFVWTLLPPKKFEEAQRTQNVFFFSFEIVNGFHHRIGALIFCTKANPPFSCLVCHSKS